jgi:hypothetical protein
MKFHYEAGRRDSTPIGPSVRPSRTFNTHGKALFIQLTQEIDQTEESIKPIRMPSIPRDCHPRMKVILGRARNQEIISFQLDEPVELDEPDFRSD